MAQELCAACRTITLSMFLNGFQHPLDYNQILVSQNCCRLCALMLTAYDTQTCVTYPKRECDKIHRGRLTWSTKRLLDSDLRWGMFKLDYYHFGTDFQVCTLEDSGLFQRGILTQREIQAADSQRNIRLLCKWLEECRLNHDECQVGPCSGKRFDDHHCSTTLPFRVIDVGPSDGSVQPRLWTTHGQGAGRYLTLSHCWGEVEPPKTTKATLSASHSSLPDSQLSKTFQDAIRLTRELGEQFLWIDSLCIVQDDADELDAQIGLMGEIFEGSYCTIAAIDAKGVDGLLPMDRGLFISGPGRFKTAHLRFNDEDDNLSGELHDVFIIENPNKDVYHIQLEKSAWHSRGWVFQERTLSRRCVFFSEENVGWRCNRYWETEQTGVPEHREPRNIPVALSTSSRTIGNFNFNLAYQVRSFWEGYVRDYSQTRLTYISDKEKALRGLTQQLSGHFHATFHYGILNFGTQENLNHQLLWYSSISYANGLKGDQMFRCPSWSWMVVDGRVLWTTDGDLAPSESLSRIHFGEPESDGTQELHISGLGCTINIGTLVGDLPRFSKFQRWAPETHFGDLTALIDTSTTRTLLNSCNEIIGWVTIDAFDGSIEVTATPVQQYFRLLDEEEPLCIDFLALVKAPIQKDSTVLNSKERHIRIGRGRVLKTAFSWLENCQPRNFFVV